MWHGIVEGVVARHCGQVFCVARYCGKVFCVARYSGEAFWQDILVKYSGKALDQVFGAKFCTSNTLLVDLRRECLDAAETL
jgi:hypothetical protein